MQNCQESLISTIHIEDTLFHVHRILYINKLKFLQTKRKKIFLMYNNYVLILQMPILKAKLLV